MVIHTVRAGETLTEIAGAYGVAPGLVARVNGLRQPYPLAVGQSLLILTPAQLHTVQPGETLWTIAGRCGISPLALLRNNPNLEGRASLYPGQILVVAWTDVPTRDADVNGYAYPYVDEAVLRGILPYTTFLTPFTYGISAAGGLVQLEDRRLVALAGQYGAAAWMHLSTLTESGVFSNDRAAQVLRDPAAQEALAQLAVERAALLGYRGIDVDFEFIDPEQAELYAEFVGRLRRLANAQGMEVVTALAPKVSAAQAGVLYEGHNYRLLGENSDAVLLMTYEWGYT